MISLYRKYAGIVGAFAFSGANFVLAFALQHGETPHAFGLFALIQVLLQFGISVSNALFCAPAVVALPVASDRTALRSFARANFLYCAAGATSVALAMMAIGASPGEILGAGVLCFLSWMRWFLRAVELANSNFDSPARADLAYAIAVGVPALILGVQGSHNIGIALGVQIFGCLAAFLGLRGVELAEMAGGLRAPFEPFLASLREHGGWSLLGVVTTEATANAHAWVVGLYLGPAAFAPIAAVTLFFRPVLILTQSLTQYERPRMAKAIRDNAGASLEQHRVGFTRLLALCLAGNALLVFVILYWAPETIGNGQYRSTDLWTVSGVVVLTYVARVLRGAESAALQAGGVFRPLAMVTVYAAPLTVVGVAIAAIIPGSSTANLMMGVLFGEVITCVLIRREHYRFMALARGVA